MEPNELGRGVGRGGPVKRGRRVWQRPRAVAFERTGRAAKVDAVGVASHVGRMARVKAVRDGLGGDGGNRGVAMEQLCVPGSKQRNKDTQRE